MDDKGDGPRGTCNENKDYISNWKGLSAVKCLYLTRMKRFNNKFQQICSSKTVKRCKKWNNNSDATATHKKFERFFPERG